MKDFFFFVIIRFLKNSMTIENSPGWSQSLMPESVSENRRRAMQSNLFSDTNLSPKPNISSSQSRDMASQRPPQPTFMNMPSSPQKGQQPELNLNLNAPEVPALSPFPDFSLDVGKITESFDLEVKPRPPVESKPIRKLNFTTGNQMKLMRDDLARDFSEFSKRMKRLTSNEVLKMETIKFTDPPVSQYQNKMNTINLQKTQKANMNKSMQRNNLNFNQSQKMSTEEDEAPSFTTVSEFLLPDGSKYT